MAGDLEIPLFYDSQDSLSPAVAYSSVINH